MVHLLFPDGTTRDLEAESVHTDVSTGITSCKDCDGNLVATFARGELLALSYKPFSPELIRAYRESVDSQIIERCVSSRN